MSNYITNQYLISTSELAKRLGTTNDVIINVAKRCNINKEIRNGVVTYWNEQEVTQIIKELKDGNKSNNRSFELTQRLENTATSITIKENFLKAGVKMLGFLNKKKLSIKKFIENNDLLLLQTLNHYFEWHMHQYEDHKGYCKIMLSIKDCFNFDEQEFHFVLTVQEFKELVKFTKKLRSRVKVFLPKENRYRTTEDEIQQS